MKILVTGAGGSIGSALCKHLDGNDLILYESNEYALYKINEELKGPRLAVLGDIKDKDRLKQFKPDVVYHCAAYKHVPLLEEPHNKDQAFKNNVDGTIAVMEAFEDAESIVLLSTDKAIKPICNMGASKLIAENITLKHKRVVARLGNILESSGSVIPKFKKQIREGGPVTVTDPRATRYFIEMDKAVEFLVSCSQKASGTYMVDMGEPRKILDIALELIGDKNILIQYTGLRPGEKLHEDLS